MIENEIITPDVENPRTNEGPLLAVQGLKTHFITRQTTRRAVDGVSFHVNQGKTLGIVGESGCGKSVTSLSILRLIPEPPGRIVDGQILLRGRNLLELTEKEMQKVRGNQISMIFQEPMTSLNPVFTIGSQVAEVFRIHMKLSRREAFARAVDMLDQVNIPEAARRAREYPHQMSGGMRQRVMIAMALGCNPELLIADEPTTALDVTVQAQILELMNTLQSRLNSSILMITHDLGVIAETSDDVAVMYAGQVVEYAATTTLFDQPLHPYTQGLMRSVPRIDWITRQQKIEPIPGIVPDPADHPAGCRFHPRCPFVTDQCRTESPDLLPAREGHTIRCHRWLEISNDPNSAVTTTIQS
jgi:oligopeptide/dipeptide ABC transporter ATP-binding protein